ncbi:TraB/GumN family protein [candidate division KSB1 bacterium]|nr:TraB/GumN family protein [candidate division KSB1 bacterium]
MDIKKLKIFVILLWLIGTVPSRTEDNKHTIWQVKSNTNTVYLVGSIHLLKKDNYPLDLVYNKAFMDADKVVFEINPDSMAVPGIQFIMLGAALCDSGKTLQSYISEETSQLALEKTKELGLDLEGLKQFKPWFVATTITAQVLGRLGFDAQYGLDMYFAQKAKQSAKKMSGLETVQYQLNIFTQMSDDMQELLLRQTLEDMEIIETELGKIVSAWETGHLEALEEDLLASFTEYPQVYQSVIVDRNNNWLKKIDGFLQRKTNYFIVVGTGHLLGEDGLVQRLKKMGYIVNQM